ncbi:MAG: tetratricopeptide repeat protein [Planctomycetota bacterium]
MAKTSKAGDSALSVEPNGRLTTTPEDKSKAQKWFLRARELGDKRQFDYAIEYFVNGIEFWPDAVEEACKPLHGCAVARRQTGGKKPGLKDSMTRSMTDKDAKKAFLNSLWLFGHEPDNVSYIEGVARNAARLRAENVAFWAAGVCLKTLDSAPKSTLKSFLQLAELIEALGDRAAARNESPMAVSAYQLGVESLSAARRRSSKDQALDEALRHMSTKLTILKGKYKDGAGSYRDSIVDNEEQRDLHDEQRSIQADERVDELVDKVQKEYEENPDDGAKVRTLIDLLCRREREEDERKAIEVLVFEFKRTGNYRWKLLADDIRMKQHGRKARELAKSGDEAAIKEQQVAQLRYELSVFKERSERYPTDNRIKFEYAVRNFKAGRFDEAIPLLQVARNDPKNRIVCEMYLGRCFFRKGYHDQAIPTLESAIAGYDVQDDELAKSLLYWLARSQEGAGRTTDAKQTYGKLLQVDYNYKDVRARMDASRG